MEKKVIRKVDMYYVEPKKPEDVGYYYFSVKFTDNSKEYFYKYHFDNVLGQKGQLAFRQMMLDNDFVAFADAEIEYEVVVKDEKEQIIINSLVFNDEFGLLDILVKKLLVSMI